MGESRNKRVLIVDNNEEESGRLGVMLQRRATIRSPHGVGLKRWNS